MSLVRGCTPEPRPCDKGPILLSLERSTQLAWMERIESPEYGAEGQGQSASSEGGNEAETVLANANRGGKSSVERR
jgi:hypothetical protein